MTAEASCLSAESIDRVASGLAPSELEESHLRVCSACAAALADARASSSFLSSVRSLARDHLEGAPAFPSIPGFEIVREIDRGAQGVVFEGRRTGTGDRVALKVLDRSKGRTTKQRLRFEREVELASRLRHPGVVRIEGHGLTVEGRPWLAMEFIDGLPLDEHPLGRPAPQEGISHGDHRRQTVELLAQAAEAVAEAHRHGVIHRDLKPSNIIVDGIGRPHVVDFGLAREVDSARLRATASGEFVGSIAYAAPEQLSGHSDSVDVRADVYALGVIAYGAILGEAPFDPALPLADLVRVVREGNVRRPSSISGPAFDADLEAILMKSLARNPADRYGSAEALGADLRRWLRGEPVEARGPGRWSAAQATMRRHRAAIGVIGAVTLVSLIAAVLLGIAWRRAADAERLASERATRLADALIASDVDRARLSELGGQLAIAEALAWNVKLSMPPPHDDEVGEDDALAEQAHWILRAVYDASPCTASLQFPAGMQPATIRFSEDGRQMQVLSIAGVVSRWNGPGTDIVVEEPIPGERRIPQRSSRDGWALFREGSAEFMGRDGRRHRIAMPPLASEAQRCAADDHVRAVALILDDGTALFVDHAGKEMIRVNGELPAMRLAISPGGRYGAVGPQSGPCRVFELATRREIGLIGSWRSTSLRFSPDDRFVAILDANVINICELPSLEVVKTLVGAATWISDVTWSSTGTRLASVGWDRQATVWDVENERPLVRLAGLTDVGVCVAFDPGDSRLAAMDRSGTLRLFKVEPPAPMRMIPFESCAPFSLALGAAPGEIAVGAENGDVLWRLPGGTPQRWRAHDGVTSAIAFLPDHAGLVTSGYDGDVRAWTPGGELRWSTEVGDLINHLIVAADRSHVIVSKQSGEVLWLRLPDGRPARAVLAHSGRSIRVGQDPRGQWVLSGGSDGRLMRIDGSSSVAVEIDRFTGAIRALAVDPTGRFVAAAGDDREIRVYETQSWTIASVLAQHEASIFALAFDGAGHTLASGDAEGFIRLSRGPRWADVGGWREHDSMCFDLGLDASGRTLFSISRDASLLVRALDTADECIAGNLGYRAARAAAQGRDVPALAAHEAWAIDVLRRGP